MTARYRESETQRELGRLIEETDRTTADFFVKAPIVIDLSADREGFGAATRDDRARALLYRYERGDLTNVSYLSRPAYIYVRTRLKERFNALDRDAVVRLTTYLGD